MLWTKVDEVGREICAFEDASFPFGVWTDEYDKMDGKLVGCKIDSLTPNGRSILDLLERLCDIKKTDYGYELTVLSAVSDLWLKTLEYVNSGNRSADKRNGTFKNKTIKAMILYVQEHYREIISVDALATAAHISRSECFRCFKYYTGKTPIDYINSYRLSAAAKLLTDTEKTIAEICNTCGFANQSYFGKLFKQHYGISPLLFRNNNGD